MRPGNVWGENGITGFRVLRFRVWGQYSDST